MRNAGSVKVVETHSRERMGRHGLPIHLGGIVEDLSFRGRLPTLQQHRKHQAHSTGKNARNYLL